MNLSRPSPLLLMMPLLFFGAGALTAAVAARLTGLVAPKLKTLMEAASLGQEEAILQLVTSGEDPGKAAMVQRPVYHWKSGDTTTPLLVTIAGGDLRLVAFMLKHTTRLAESPNDRALCISAQYRHSSVTRLLLEKNAPAVPKDGCSKNERMPEDIAFKGHAKELGNLLREYRLSKEG